MKLRAQCRQQIKRETVRFWCVLIFAASVSYASDRTLEEEKSPDIIFRRVAVAGVRFDEQYVVQRCRQFLKTHQGKKLIRFTLVPDESAATIGWYGCDHCDPYPFWRAQYDAVTKEMFPIGELMAFGNDAILRYRSRDGAVTETVVSGSDPRSVAIDGFKGKIVHVFMQAQMPKPILELYLVGIGNINLDAAAEYSAAFNRQMGLNYSQVEFRSDPWFIHEIWTPWFPLFEEHRGEPPNEQAFNATKTLSCYVMLNLRHKDECHWTGGIGLE